MIEAAAAPLAQGDPITYDVGEELVASVNGYLMPRNTIDAGTKIVLDVASRVLELANGNAAAVTLGIIKLPPDSVQDEVVFDLRL